MLSGVGGAVVKLVCGVDVLLQGRGGGPGRGASDVVVTA